MGRAWQEPQAADAERAGPATEAVGDHTRQRPHRRATDAQGLLPRIGSRKPLRAILGPEGASEPQQRHNADEMGTSASFQTATAEPDVAVRKCEKSA